MQRSAKTSLTVPICITIIVNCIKLLSTLSIFPFIYPIEILIKYYISKDSRHEKRQRLGVRVYLFFFNDVLQLTVDGLDCATGGMSEQKALGRAEGPRWARTLGSGRYWPLPPKGRAIGLSIRVKTALRVNLSH